jgi:beta-aspartyl-peptidase (threonine type)
MRKTGLVIHGGAVNLKPESLDKDECKERLATMQKALDTGFQLLQQGNSSLDAAAAAVVVLEDCPLFNAGRGSVLTAAGTVEMDAAIMDGATGKCGGVAAVAQIKNPVLGARAVMDHSPHTLLCGAGAESFAKSRGVGFADHSYFLTDKRRQELAEILKEGKFMADKSLGTVGAVARDRYGNLATATSTGGLTGKLPGRIGDTPVPGAGTWADNKTCALSCTGTGDVFIRNATARDIACLMEYKGMTLDDAVREGLRKVALDKGLGGAIGISAEGGFTMSYNTTAMFRGHLFDGEESFTAIF